MMTGAGEEALYRTLTVDCGTKCAQCQLAEQRQEKFTYVPGDILLGGNGYQSFIICSENIQQTN